MTPWIAALIGFMAGGTCGVLIMALMCAAGRVSDAERRARGE